MLKQLILTYKLGKYTGFLIIQHILFYSVIELKIHNYITFISLKYKKVYIILVNKIIFSPLDILGLYFLKYVMIHNFFFF